MFDLWFVLCFLLWRGLLGGVSCVVVCFFYYIGLIGLWLCVWFLLCLCWIWCVCGFDEFC